MKAIAFESFGPPDVLKVMDVEDPKIEDNEVLIKVFNTSLNRLDLLVRSGKARGQFTLPHIPGQDIVGKIEKVGSSVKNFTEGEIVVANPLWGCGKCEFCLSGNETMCLNWKGVSLHSKGSYAEYIKVYEKMLIRPPKRLSTVDLAAMILTYSTVWRALVTLGNLRSDMTVMVWGASGGVGSFAVKLAKSFNAKVIASVGSDFKREIIKKLGPDLIVDTYSDKAVNEIIDFTEGRGVDIVLEIFSGANLNCSIQILKPGGKIIVFGVLQGIKSEIDVMYFYRRDLRILGTHHANNWEILKALEYADKNNIKPLVYDVADIKNASYFHKLMEENKIYGKVIFDNTKLHET